MRCRNGLSPHARRNCGVSGRGIMISGPILRIRGNRGLSLYGPESQDLSPRVRGTAMQLYIPVTYSVLFPRVRGNPLVDPMELTPVRFIPACTGEPHPRLPFRHTSMVYPRVYGGNHRPLQRHGCGIQVYPRVYGGTIDGLLTGQSHFGLSPRVRGNRAQGDRRHRAGRSIPACTGEPRRRGS